MRDEQKHQTQGLPSGTRAVFRLVALFVALAISGLIGCGSKKKKGSDLEVRWSVDGESVATVCQDILVTRWVVEAQIGENTRREELDCGEDWTTAGAFQDLPAGKYTITVIGLDDQGKEVGRSYTTEVILDGTADTTHDVALFTSIGVFWNINGTVDGTAMGDSWDSCAEVGAQVALITVDDRAPVEASCDTAGEMGVEITDLAIGTHTVKVKLQDGSGNDLTTEGTADFEVGEIGTDFVVDFYYDSFFEPKQSDTVGSYWFRTLFGGDTCTAATPAVSDQIALVKLDGTPVDGAQVCDANQAVCANADGAAPLACDSDDQVMPNLTWGAYKLVLQGTAGDDDTICWETSEGGNREIEILIGAGAENPVDPIDLARISSEGDCS